MRLLALALLATAAWANCINKGWSYCRRSRTCAAGYGDCDHNNECKAGLSCVSSKAGQPVYGSAVDCCQCPATTGKGGWSACSVNCKCGAHGGDCDSDHECISGFHCRSSNPSQSIYGSAVDYCCPKLGSSNACLGGKCKCAHGQGKCTKSSQCHKDLACRSKYCCNKVNTGAKKWHACDNKNCKCGHGDGDCDSSSQCLSGHVCRSSKNGQALRGSAMDYCCKRNSCDSGRCKCHTKQGYCSNDNQCHTGLKCRAAPKSAKKYCCPAKNGKGANCDSICGCATGLICAGGRCAPPPTKPPTKAPTKTPTKTPTKSPTKRPTKAPTKAPTKFPTKAPTKEPTKSPTKPPTKAPTKTPTKTPTKAPTKKPTTCQHGRKNGGASFCTSKCPCGHGQGDCDTDKECQTGTKCTSGALGVALKYHPYDYCMVPLQRSTTETSCQSARGKNLEYLDRQNVNAGTGNLMQGFRLHSTGCSGKNMRTRVHVVKASGLAVSCTGTFTTCRTARNHKLEFEDRQDVQCPYNKKDLKQTSVIQRWQLTGGGCSGNKMRTYKRCCKVSGGWQLGKCHERYTNCEVSRNHPLEFWDRQDVKCKDGEVLQRFQLMNTGCPGNKQKVTYRCCTVVPKPAIVNVAGVTASDIVDDYEVEADLPADETTTDEASAEVDTQADAQADEAEDEAQMAEAEVPVPQEDDNAEMLHEDAIGMDDDMVAPDEE